MGRMDKNKSQEATDLFHISNALGVAVINDFMARAHAAIIWKKVLKESGFDIPKTNPIQPAFPVNKVVEITAKVNNNVKEAKANA